MSTLDKLYSRLPTFLQHLAVTAYGVYWHELRFGGRYRQIEAEYRKRDHFNRDDWKKYQHERLIEILKIAVEQVPYYRRTFNKAQKQAAQSGDLSSLPLLNKEPIRQDPKEFLRDDWRRKRSWIFNTSGSTGTPIATYWTAEEIRESLAVREARSANWAGVSFKLPRATFSGRLVEPDPESAGPFYRYNLAEKQVYFSAFHLRPQNAQKYVDALKKHRIHWMTGYAVSIFILAKFILEQHIHCPSLKAVITTSEKLTHEMRTTMEKAYGCRVFEEYSTVENVLFASECEQGRLHVSPDVGLVEILRPDGSNCVIGEVGEVVATCLMRTLQPLIRFQLGDLAAWDGEPCACGRQMPVIKEVVGRIEDVVIGLDGRQMVRFHGIFVNQPNVIEGQIIQEALDKIVVNVVPTQAFDQGDELEIIHRVQQRLGTKVDVSVQLVDHIPRTAAGKFQAVISKIR